MENRILEILLELQNNLSELQNNLSELQNDMKTVKADMITENSNILVELQNDMKTVKTDIQEIKETVNRIEESQSEDVIGLLKATKKKTDFEADYINNRITEMDKRLFQLEKRIEN
ncbi:hypothetical protein M670_01706 [Schinkia azotoformans MEV2011]|uniref:Uncharacterized protein n=1 Tax=Schinkia azotoformans MEV2011 TaxID=1348973 RepID=A0A072P068_SCHAZ|nr:hypothetical protein [Schinkia azotoformans]KEF38890.1 hypothetical protein M670_01706 [Schinkia azotoformans MEV2011]MEC1695693.1 hypothetical protein [Schinkia azotoformans]MEC1727356.1 hypothetical protein [Schinkia azotoformans]MEC1770275.1 hypothetical protein [Schinkia azotoformans]MEC1780676.1 hypothetical protein [Schinkia azotoformans]